MNDIERPSEPKDADNAESASKDSDMTAYRRGSVVCLVVVIIMILEHKNNVFSGPLVRCNTIE